MAEDIEEILSKRNTATFQQAIITINAKLQEQQTLIETLRTALASQSEKIQSLERTVLIQKAMSAGHGPSVKG